MSRAFVELHDKFNGGTARAIAKANAAPKGHDRMAKAMWRVIDRFAVNGNYDRAVAAVMLQNGVTRL